MDRLIDLGERMECYATTITWMLVQNGRSPYCSVGLLIGGLGFVLGNGLGG